ncbi:MAG TPA: DUF2203 domain-containing protein [Acidobacteriota bacterium]|nr:DUF2203 domain-containing protein [Acidobacteriota bacterium]
MSRNSTSAKIVAHKFNKHFTVEEAEALLPFILSVFEQVQALREEMAAFRDDLQRVHEAAPGNGGDAKGTTLVEFSETIGRLLKTLDDKGILVKDIEGGIIDFPHLREDREVLLCWRMGEKTVSYWHDLDAGYRGRQPL